MDARHVLLPTPHSSHKEKKKVGEGELKKMKEGGEEERSGSKQEEESVQFALRGVRAMARGERALELFQWFRVRSHMNLQ